VSILTKFVFVGHIISSTMEPSINLKFHAPNVYT